MLFHKNRNTQIQVYTIERLELETYKTCEAHSIIHWGEELAEDRRSCHQVPVASIAVIKLLILRNMYVRFQAQLIYFSLCFFQDVGLLLLFFCIGWNIGFRVQVANH